MILLKNTLSRNNIKPSIFLIMGLGRWIAYHAFIHQSKRTNQTNFIIFFLIRTLLLFLILTSSLVDFSDEGDGKKGQVRVRVRVLGKKKRREVAEGSTEHVGGETVVGVGWTILIAYLNIALFEPIPALKAFPHMDNGGSFFSLHQVWLLPLLFVGMLRFHLACVFLSNAAESFLFWILFCTQLLYFTLKYDSLQLIQNLQKITTICSIKCFLKNTGILIRYLSNLQS